MRPDRLLLQDIIEANDQLRLPEFIPARRDDILVVAEPRCG